MLGKDSGGREWDSGVGAGEAVRLPRGQEEELGSGLVWVGGEMSTRTLSQPSSPLSAIPEDGPPL